MFDQGGMVGRRHHLSALPLRQLEFGIGFGT